jgi:broad specificity phosphatase PhoE
MNHVVLVRHATPAHGPERPAHEWALDPEGAAAARELAAVLPTDAYLVASAEPKAWQTLEPAGPVIRDARFNEVNRDEPYDGDWVARRRAYVAGTDHPGWGARVRVAERFEAGVSDHLAAAEDRTLVVASHGMAMTVWLAARVGLDDPVAFWAGLRFPERGAPAGCPRWAPPLGAPAGRPGWASQPFAGLAGSSRGHGFRGDLASQGMPDGSGGPVRRRGLSSGGSALVRYCMPRGVVHTNASPGSSCQRVAPDSCLKRW